MKENENNNDLDIDGFDFGSLADALAKEVNSDMEENAMSDVPNEESSDSHDDDTNEFDVEDSEQDDFFIDVNGIFDDDVDEDDYSDDDISSDYGVDYYDEPDLTDDEEDEDDEEDDDAGTEGKRKHKWIKVAVIAFIATCLIVPAAVFLVMWSGVYTNFNNQNEQEEEFEFERTHEPGSEQINYDDVDWSNAISGSTRYDENVVNILLLGEDGQSDQGHRSNSDTMIILTINKNEKKIKMTSIMRDLYVRIPDHKDNKINSAYSTGGVELIKKTIEENFKVAIDYAIVVQFDTYKAVIDELGGVDVEINEKEAKFINEKCASGGTNLSAGKVHLNGRECLWFSRIRKIDSDIYGTADFGRTARQRTVLSQIFQKYKDLNYAQIASLAQACLPYVQTDLDPQTIIKCVALVLSYKVDEIESLRIPMDGKYKFADVYFESVGRDLNVIMINDYMEENVDAMHMFIYGDLRY